MSLLHFTGLSIKAAEQGKLPDAVVRVGIRRLLARRQKKSLRGGCEEQQRRRSEFIERCRNEPIAAVPEKANEQHYEVPAELFVKTLGPRLKYSCCYWPEGVDTLTAAEEAALSATCERAGIENGQTILDFGCGWGSLSLWMAEHFPDSRIVSVSNSSSQREFIERRASVQGLRNVEVRTADVNDFEPHRQFDRVVSVEMFEHVRNHPALLSRISNWLKPHGKLFVHIFCHRSVPYFFESTNDADWMTNHFFSGGVMPCDDLLIHYQQDLKLTQHWRWSGMHYARTCRAWLENLDSNRADALELLSDTYGHRDAALWLQRWRMFYMACEELFAFRGGNEWWVSHYLFEK